MYNYQLWLVLRESTSEINAGSLDDKLDKLRIVIAEKLYCAPNAPVQAVNNEFIFQCCGSHNHRGDVHDRLLFVIEWITKQLPGSYGLVYWYDDESPGRRNFDGYNVIVVARGAVTNRYDPFLSPIAPTVED